VLACILKVINSVRGVKVTTKDTAKIGEKLKREMNWIESNGL